FTYIESWQKQVMKSGEEKLIYHKMMELKEKQTFGIFRKEQKILTSAGIKEVRRALGLKKYLNDYSLIDERHPEEVRFWDYYLIYASIFGIADKVAKTFKELYPQRFKEYQQMHNNLNVYDTLSIIYAISRSYTSGVEAAQSSRLNS